MRFRSGCHPNSSEELDRADGADPQISERLFVSFCDEAHSNSDSSDEVESSKPDRSKLMAAMETIFGDVLTRQERFVLIRRQIVGDTYADIADLSWPRLSGPSQARKIEQRALRKMKERLSKFR
jgi:hypothetical protein